MNDAAPKDPTGLPAADEPEAVDAQAPDAVPKRRARKTAAKAASGEAAAEVAAPADADVPTKPASRARRKAAAGTEAAPTAGLDAPTAQALAEAVPSADASLSVAVPAAPASPPPERAIFSLAPEPVQATEPEASAEPAPAGDPGTGAAAQPAAAEAGWPQGQQRRRRDRDRPRERDRDGPREATADPERGAAGGDDEAEGSAAADPNAGLPPLERVDAQVRFADVLSGQYDTENPEDEAGAAAPAPRRVLRPEPEAPKLHKVLAQAGIGSRRDMEDLILEGQVTVNGEPAHLGMRITQGDQIKVAGKPVKVRIAPPPARVLAYHKPVGEVVTHHDPEGRPTVFRRLPRLPHGKWLSVGRLDINTEGLLLFTNSGELSHQLMHPRFGIEREYAVRVLGLLGDEARESLLEGVDIDGQKAAFKSIEDGGGEGANHWYRVVINEGRNREVRRLFDAAGLQVSRLIRIRYGAVVLPRGLKRGTWVELDDEDVRAVRRAVGMDRGERPGQAGHGQQGHAQGPGPGFGQGKKNRNKRRGGGNPNGPYPPQGGAPQQRQAVPRQEPRDARDQRPAGGDEVEDDDVPLHIPNPLEQTFDRRFATGSKRISAGFGRPSDDEHRAANAQPAKGPKQPDPMQTSVGYIGADAYFRKAGGGKGRNRRGR